MNVKKYSNKILILLLTFFVHSAYSVQVAPTDINASNEGAERTSGWYGLRRTELREMQPDYAVPRGSIPRIRSIDHYIPEEVDSQNLLAAFLLHGSWSKGSRLYKRNQSLAKEPRQVYRHTQRMISWLATILKRRAHLISVKWLSRLQDVPRKQAADLIRDFLIKNADKYKGAKLVMIGHSHGCNVINIFTHQIPREIAPNDEDPKIFLLVYLGCPVKDDVTKRGNFRYQPINYKKLWYIHSDGDGVTVGGRDDGRSFDAACFALSFGATSAMVAHGAFFIATGGGSIPLIGISHYVAPIIAHVLALYSSAGSLSQLVEYSREVLGKDNHFPRLDDAITCGFKMKDGGFDSSHNGLNDVIQLLPQIIEKAYTEFPHNVSRSGNFHFNIDREGRRNFNDSQEMLDRVYLMPYSPEENDERCQPPERLPESFVNLTLNALATGQETLSPHDLSDNLKEIEAHRGEMEDIRFAERYSNTDRRKMILQGLRDQLQDEAIQNAESGESSQGASTENISLEGAADTLIQQARGSGNTSINNVTRLSLKSSTFEEKVLGLGWLRKFRG